MKNLFKIIVCVVAFANSAQAQTTVDKDIQKTLKALVNAIRYNKDDLAAKQITFSGMAKELLADSWAKASNAEQAEITKGLETIIRKVSFPKGRDMFQYLDAVLYDVARVEGDRVRCKSTVVVHRDYKKAEIVIDWVLVKDGTTYKVLDTAMLGESTLASIRDEQVKPILAEGGIPKIMETLRAKVTEVSKK